MTMMKKMEERLIQMKEILAKQKFLTGNDHTIIR